jgi:hypothetical protein
MIKSSIARWTIGVVVALAVLGLLRFKPWQRDGSSAVRQQLHVGFLPVT